MIELLKLKDDRGWSLEFQKDDIDLKCLNCRLKQVTPYFYCREKKKIICIDCESLPKIICKSLEAEHEHFNIISDKEQK